MNVFKVCDKFYYQEWLITEILDCETIGSTVESHITPQGKHIYELLCDRLKCVSVCVTAFAGLPPPTLALLMEAVGVDVQAEWENVGLGLGLEQSTLDTIRSDCGRDASRCMRNVFTQWKNSVSSEYSWRNLAVVLCSRTLNKAGLLPQILKRIVV